MYTGLVVSLSVAWIFLLLVDGCAGMRNWEYEPISIDVRTTDASKVQAEAKVERTGRSEYSFTCKMLLNYDMDDTLTVEATIYRSFSGSEDDYKLLPFSVPKQTFKRFAETHYKDMIYKNVKQCSNIPEPEKAYPWPKGTYIFDKCTATGDGLPEVLPEGYYKINFTFSADIEAGLTVIVRLTTINGLLG